ncbi:hypothetical protein OVA03_12745 [Asticcacaulis sp. SL142]|uniref:hypothetical protein n=1 Tax=Asticcacaulis sp. SL142 TaxID=2995155 RepID=UPI00226C9B80|nr:hypothetical protein [Asticcacaulis sp. SL142]WAC47564.1 hypothetical protein OVA03_12745 [Asticcacaulis sp. SL142]
MPINADGYIHLLRNHLKLEKYGKTCLAAEARSLQPNQISLSEALEDRTGRRKIVLQFDGDILAVKLDADSNPLYNFLLDERHPWSKRCDFIIFQSINNQVKAYCIEFKEARTRIPLDNIMLQLKAAEAWVCTLNKLISSYLGETHAIQLSKFVFTACENPAPDLDISGRYLARYPSIRHYLFDDVDGVNLSSLENATVNTIN